MNRNVLETVMGALVLAVALIFLTFAYSSAGITTVSGYEITAKFDHIDGIKVGSDVRINGVKVGTVTSTKLDPSTYQVQVRMTVDKTYQVPVDTVAAIVAPSLLGDSVVSLTTGADDKMIAAGGTIGETVSPVSLMSMLGQFVYSVSNQSGSASGAKPAESSPSPSSPEPSKPDAASQP